MASTKQTKRPAATPTSGPRRGHASEPTPGADPHDPKTHPEGNAEKDPKDWTTGGEPMTGAQKSYLKTLTEEAGEPFDESLTKGEASQRIEELKGGAKHVVEHRAEAATETACEDPKTHPTGNAEKDPKDWTTGGEPMTGAQKSYLKTLCEEAGVEFDDKLTKGEASMKIDELKNRTGRGK